MKRLLPLIAIVALVGCEKLERVSTPRHTDPSNSILSSQPLDSGIRTIIVAGQSNAESRVREGDAEGYSVTGLVSIRESAGHSFRTPTKDTTTDRLLSWLVAGDILASRSGKQVRFVNQAFGGINSRQYAEQQSAGLRDMVNEDKANAVVWVQGEADYEQGFTEQESYENLKSIILRVKASRDIPFFVALNSVGSALDAHSDWSTIPVRRAQERLIREGLAERGPDCDLLRLSHPTDAGRIHFIGDGQVEHGRIWAAILQQKLM